MKAIELREKFLKYFENQGHTRVRSASLIPHGDATLYFCNAGMVPFKQVFTGEEKRDYSRAASSQKCMRVSGKHNDLENVGHTARHHTFFEMLGNFSFGDYFKKDAIRFAWEFLTQEVGLDPDRLWITVYETDDEAAQLWESEVGVAKDRILRFGDEENFWSMGPTGPCGPCSEIHYDHGPEAGTSPEDVVNGEGDRYMEIWNLVFMQYDRDESGKMTPLPKPSIDTGMGLERLAAAVQGVHSNYETDLFTPLIDAACKLTGVTYGKDAQQDASIHVLADHIRATAFLIADGVQPSNDGRGYVLRRIMRRAIRYGKLLGMNEPFFYRLFTPLMQMMGEVYPELLEHQKLITQLIEQEEKRFLETLENGLKLIQTEIENHQDDKVLPGEIVFTLYDTFGFPTDLTALIAEEKGYQIDQAGFDQQMAAQQERGRAAWKGATPKSKGPAYEALLEQGVKTEFVGYDHLSGKSPVASLIRGGEIVSKVQEGESVELITTKTPFYAESGGQVGDQGLIVTPQARLMVTDTQKLGDAVMHSARVVEGKLQTGDEVELAVDAEFRSGSMIHHSATHLFHAALRQVLGEHVRQAGSLVTPHRTRFDFTHFQPLTAQEISQIEDLVNEQIRNNLTVMCQVLPYDKAIEMGALAFFGDKYGDMVRVLSMGDFSIEFCGGTHVEATGQIGLFKIVGQSAVGSGVRRIEAVVGPEALAYFRSMEHQVEEIATRLNTNPKEVLTKLEKYLDQVTVLEKEVASLKSRLMSGSAGESTEQVQEINGVKVMTLQSEVADKKLVRKLSDDLMKKVGSGIVVIAASDNGKARLVVRVTEDLTKKYKAGDLIKQLAPIVGGKGGGRPDMAEAGGDDASKIPEVFKELPKLL